MGNLNKDEIKLIKKFVNKIDLNLDEGLRQKLFDSFYPFLDYSEFQKANIWESIIFVEFQYLIKYSPIKKEKKPLNNDNLWGKSAVGPVG